MLIYRSHVVLTLHFPRLVGWVFPRDNDCSFETIHSVQFSDLLLSSLLASRVAWSELKRWLVSTSTCRLKINVDEFASRSLPLLTRLRVPEMRVIPFMVSHPRKWYQVRLRRISSCPIGKIRYRYLSSSIESTSTSFVFPFAQRSGVAFPWSRLLGRLFAYVYHDAWGHAIEWFYSEDEQ